METFYKVTNPTKEDISIMYKGTTYTLPADGELENLSEDVKSHWSSLHAFLYFAKMPKKIIKQELENIMQEEIIETVAMPTEEVVVEEVVTEVENTEVESTDVEVDEEVADESAEEEVEAEDEVSDEVEEAEEEVA